MNPRTHLQIFFIVALLTFAAIAPAGDLQLKFESDRVIAEGVVPGSEAVFFGMTHYYISWRRFVTRIDHVVVDEDRDGVVEFVWKDGLLPYRSVWLVVDTRSGKSASAVPPNAIDRNVDISFDDVIRDGNDITGLIQREHRYLEVFLFHPGFGSWGLASGDGSPWDADGEYNGQIQIDFEDMYRIHGNNPAPFILPNGGIIALVDGATLEYGVGRVTGGESGTPGIVEFTTYEEAGR